MDGVIFINFTNNQSKAVRVNYREAIELYSESLEQPHISVDDPVGFAEDELGDSANVGNVYHLGDKGLLAIIKL